MGSEMIFTREAPFGPSTSTLGTYLRSSVLHSLSGLPEHLRNYVERDFGMGEARCRADWRQHFTSRARPRCQGAAALGRLR